MIRCKVCGPALTVYVPNENRVDLDMRGALHVIHEHADRSEFTYDFEVVVYDAHEEIE